MKEKMLELLEKIDMQCAASFKPAAACKEKVLKNALAEYAKGCTADKAVAVMDTSVFGGGKTGFLLTEEELYSSHYMKRDVPEKYLRFAEIADVQDGHRKGTVLLTMRDGSSREIFLSIYKDGMKELLQEILKLKNGAGAEPQPKPIVESQPKPEPKPAADSGPKAEDSPAAYAELCREAERLWSRGERREAKAKYNQAVELGWKDPEIARRLGEYSEFDLQYEDKRPGYNATVWYRRGAEWGDSECQRLMGLRCLVPMWGLWMVGQDQRMALMYMRQSARQGNTEAQYQLGVLLRGRQLMEQEVFRTEQARKYLEGERFVTRCAEGKEKSLNLGLEREITEEEETEGTMWLAIALLKGSKEADAYCRKVGNDQERIIRRFSEQMMKYLTAFRRGGLRAALVDGVPAYCMGIKDCIGKKGVWSYWKIDYVDLQTLELKEGAVCQDGKGNILYKERKSLPKTFENYHLIQMIEPCEHRELQYLYEEEEEYYLLDQDSYEEYVVDEYIFKSCLMRLENGRLFRSQSIGGTEEPTIFESYYFRGEPVAFIKQGAEPEPDSRPEPEQRQSVDSEPAAGKADSGKEAGLRMVPPLELCRHRESQYLYRKDGRCFLRDQGNGAQYTIDEKAFASLVRGREGGLRGIEEGTVFDVYYSDGEPVAFIEKEMELQEQPDWNEEELLSKAMDLFKGGEQKRALEIWLFLAERGNAEAQNSAGVCYQEGKGAEADIEKAVYWYQKSAAQGLARACGNLGLLYAKGKGVEQDAKKAAELYKEAARQGSMLSQYRLAEAYRTGEGVEQDCFAAAQWYQAAAEKGHVQSAEILGKMYEVGLGVKQDLSEAVAWYRTAAENGGEDAMYELALCYANGNGVEKDLKAALEWGERVKEAGHENGEELVKALISMEQAEQLWEAGKQTEAAQMYETLVKLGWQDVKTARRIGDYFEKEAKEKIHSRMAVWWHQKAAEWGDSECQFKTGIRYILPEWYAGGSPNEKLALEFFEAAAKQGHTAAQFNLGALLSGVSLGKPGVSRREILLKEELLDVEKGHMWLKKAAEGGHEQAIQLYRETGIR